MDKKYISKEIINLKNKVNKLNDISRKYDLIYLYASPIYDEKGNEMDSPISYMEEIRIIKKLMESTKKQFNCKFECIGENILRETIVKSKTKILHISAHSIYDKKYSLVVKKKKKYGQTQYININS